MVFAEPYPKQQGASQGLESKVLFEVNYNPNLADSIVIWLKNVISLELTRIN